SRKAPGKRARSLSRGFPAIFLWGERPTALGTPRRSQGCRPADPLPPVPSPQASLASGQAARPFY
ncbi:hypothetical protein, partial [Enterocloster clostridioformis]|uniref:hypothetical protein n=1 Tax=Enterocloster clostridioformis TaxID=1531 RepID=UPI001A9B98FF